MFRQMEKLIELLREYNMSNQSPYILGDADYYVDGGLYAPQIISKSRGFIKWLVENEKIDVKELEKSDRPFDVGYATEETLYERVLMLLSIQDEPIEFLVSIIK